MWLPTDPRGGSSLPPPAERKKLALALGLPLLLVAVVLMFLPANEPTGAEPAPLRRLQTRFARIDPEPWIRCLKRMRRKSRISLRKSTKTCLLPKRDRLPCPA